MPWCDDCSRYWSPMSMRSGTCPTCGRELETIVKPEDMPKVPWHFTLLLVAIGLYLAWRFVGMGAWLIDRF